MHPILAFIRRLMAAPAHAVWATVSPQSYPELVQLREQAYCRRTAAEIAQSIADENLAASLTFGGGPIA